MIEGEICFGTSVRTSTARRLSCIVCSLIDLNLLNAHRRSGAAPAHIEPLLIFRNPDDEQVVSAARCDPTQET